MTVQTQPQVTRDLRLAARQNLLPARGSGWLTGFGNMFAKEMGEWFQTRRWLWQLLIWLTIINGFVGVILFVLPILESFTPGINSAMEMPFEGLPAGTMALTHYFTAAVLTGTIGMIILTQDEIIQEKQSGTAAWILSKPVARPAFILTKLMSNITGGLVFIVALPALVTLGEIYLDIHQVVSLVPFLAGVGVFMLGLFFYLSLVILLGVLFQSRGPVMGIPFVVLLGGGLMSSFIPQIGYFLPASMDKIAQSIVLGNPLPAMYVSQMVSAAVLSIAFILAALWRFQRTEM